MTIESFLVMSATLFGLIFLVLILVAVIRPRQIPRSEMRMTSGELRKIKDQINGNEEEW